uniref:Uncharacterized protein n=1 Tax=Anopheles farauti TaxID=69004 RepID=A0A182QYJ6_9DIPT
MLKVPKKFYTLCRLCLSTIRDCDLPEATVNFLEQPAPSSSRHRHPQRNGHQQQEPELVAEHAEHELMEQQQLPIVECNVEIVCTEDDEPADRPAALPRVQCAVGSLCDGELNYTSLGSAGCGVGKHNKSFHLLGGSTADNERKEEEKYFKEVLRKGVGLLLKRKGRPLNKNPKRDSIR